MSLGYFPQIWKIIKTKSAKDIAVPSYIIFSVGTATWLCYGVYMHDITIVLSFALGVVGSWTILALTFLYRKAG